MFVDCRCMTVLFDQVLCVSVCAYVCGGGWGRLQCVMNEYF